MPTSYERLHGGHDSNRLSSTGCLALLVVLTSLTVLGILLAVAVLKRPPPPETHDVLPGGTAGSNSSDECRLTLVESIPLQVKYKNNKTFGVPLEKAWKDLISKATDQVDIVSFYWTLTGKDINVNTSSDKPGRDILRDLEELPSRNVSVRVLTSIPSVSNNSTDLKILQQKGLVTIAVIVTWVHSLHLLLLPAGVQVRSVNFGRLTGGVLHTKFWIVDRSHVFIGSANLDWRALTQVKELGVVVYNCSSLAQDLHKIFMSYWEMGLSNSSLPQPWPAQYDTTINKQRPLLVTQGNVSSSVYLSASPPQFCPPSRTLDLEAILSSISEAQHFIDVAVMAYSPLSVFHKPQRYWPFIDDALRTVAVDSKVKIRMLISCGRDSDPTMLPFLRSLASLNSPQHHIHLEIKLYIIPVKNQSDIPYSRVNHNKYMVTDKVAYIGTSNWAGDYFTTTAGVGLVISQHAPHSEWMTTLQSQLKAVFNRDWDSQFAIRLNDVGHNPDCAFET